MKRIITLLALIATASAAHAQTDSLVVFDTQGDKLGISIAGFNIALGENDKEEYTDEYIYHEPRKNAVTANLLGFSYGGTALTAMPYYGPWEGEGDFLDIYAGRFDLEGASWTVSLDKRGIFYYRIGVLASFDLYSFNNNVTLYNNESGDLMPRPLEGNVKKSRLRTTYCGVNMGLGFKIHKVMLMVS